MIDGVILLAALKLVLAIVCSFKAGPWMQRQVVLCGLTWIAVMLISIVIFAWASVVLLPADATALRTIVLFVCLIAGASVAWVRGGWKVLLGLAAWAMAAQFGLIVAPGSIIADILAGWMVALVVLAAYRFGKRLTGKGAANP